MADDDLIAYVMGELPANERALVDAQLRTDAEMARRLTRLQRLLAPLAADREPIAPPPGLASLTVARLAEYLVERGESPVTRDVEEIEESAYPEGLTPTTLRSVPHDEPEFSFVPWRRLDLIVAASIALLAVGLGLSAVGKVRQESHVRACQENLRELHTALAGYADTHDGRFPQAGTPTVPVAGSLAAELNRTGQLATGRIPHCPDAVVEADTDTGIRPAIGYSYTLGYVGEGGQVMGLRRGSDNAATIDWVPVAADLPPTVAGAAHGNGQNVLYAGGMIRFTRVPTAGINGDDIYRNDAGLVRAGLHRLDASLGRPSDGP